VSGDVIEKFGGTNNMKFFQYSKGRQKATEAISKLLIVSGKTWDVYLLFLPKNTKIDWHFDPVKGKEHYRFNLTLKGFWSLWRKSNHSIEYSIWQKIFQSHLFRPDIEEHKAEVFQKSVVLSIGWVK
jgi:hypothetical protein